MIKVSLVGLRHDESFCRRLEAVLYPCRDRWAEVFGSVAVTAGHLVTVTDSNQIGLSRERLLAKMKCRDERPIWAVEAEGRLVIWDGSHRYGSAHLLGERVSLQIAALGSF